LRSRRCVGSWISSRAWDDSPQQRQPRRPAQHADGQSCPVVFVCVRLPRRWRRRGHGDHR
jgi:hypothetical protein